MEMMGRDLDADADVDVDVDMIVNRNLNKADRYTMAMSMDLKFIQNPL